MEKPLAESPAQKPSVELRAGVFRPDWTAVTTMAAREALRGRSELRRSLPKDWFDVLSSMEDLIWRTCIDLFARLGRAPNFAELAAETGAPERAVKSLVGALQRRDLLGVSSDGGALEYVYPFTARDTGHHVHLHGHILNALCAIDALGVGAMCKTDVTIESSCMRCGTPIKLTTTQDGRCLDTISPTSLVVWYDFSSYCDNAASSCCPAIAFFCCDEHLWSLQSDRHGNRLTANEALEVGRAIFAPILAEPKRHSYSTPKDQACPSCGSSFRCGGVQGAATCWCQEYPPVLRLTSNDAKCFCPHCLEISIEKRLSACAVRTGKIER